MFFMLALRDAVLYPARSFAMVSTAGIRMFFIFIIYSYVFTYIGSPKPGITLAITLASLALYQVMNAVTFRKVFYRILRDIQRGDVEIALTRPQSYILRLCTEHVGFAILLIVPSLLLACVILYFYVGITTLPATLTSVVWGIILAALGIALSACIFICASLPALWINDAEPFIMIIDKSVMLLGGAFIPVALMPSWLATIALYSPFGAVMFVTHMFTPDFMSHVQQLVLLQLVWICIIGYGAYILFKLGIRKISINGG